MLQFSNGGLVFFKEKNQFSKKREMQMDETNGQYLLGESFELKKIVIVIVKL
jgi:hypothetical protein